MCFSTSASFGAGIVLTLIGVATLKKVQHPTQLMFAAIPLIFAVQQIAEGFLWLYIPKSKFNSEKTFFTYVFIFFAQVVWPIWVPIAIILLEKNILRKNIQRLLIVAGLIVGSYLGYCLFNYPVKASIVEHHIMYNNDYPIGPRNFGIVLYGLATIFPPFFTQIKRMWILGFGILASYIISEFFYQQYLLSVWCFFASIISISVYIIMLELTKTKCHLAKVYTLNKINNLVK